MNRHRSSRDHVERWVRKGLITPEQGDAIREELGSHQARSGRRVAQYMLAGAGAVVLIVAVAVLGDWLWPQLGIGSRSVVLAALGVGVHGFGLAAEGRAGWRPAGYLLQTAGLLIMLWAFIYSAERWDNASMGGVVVGLLSLATPLLLIPRALRRNQVMPAVHLALGLGFVAVFLSRAADLSGDAIVWSLDGVMIVVAALLVWQLASTRDAAVIDRILYAFVTALYAGLVLVVITCAGPIDLDENTIWAADAWLGIILAVVLWGLHRAPGHLRRGWFEGQLGLAVLLAIPLTAISADVIEPGVEVTALMIAAVGAAALWYGIARNAGTTLKAGALAVVVAAWYYGVERGGALGAVLALAFTAALLFWLSMRVGGREGEVDGDSDESEASISLDDSNAPTEDTPPSFDDPGADTDTTDGI